MGYTTHADCDLIGLGVSAISHVGDSFSQNPRDLPAGKSPSTRAACRSSRGMRSTRTTCCARDLIQQLMCQGEIDRRAASKRATPSISTSTSPTRWRGSQPLVDDGLVDVDGTRIAVTSRGRLLLRIIAMCFDRYLRPSAADTRRAIRARSDARGAARVTHLTCPRTDAQPDRRRRRRPPLLQHLRLLAACLDAGLRQDRSCATCTCWWSTSGRSHEGEHIFREGDPFEAIAAVRAGTVKTYVIDSEGREQVLGFFLPGEVIGLNAIRRRAIPAMRSRSTR